MKILNLALSIFCSVGHAKVPTWAANNSTKINGSTLQTVCHGTGPSVDIARAEALKSCQVNASQFFQSKIKIQSLSVETEKSVGFHQEVSSDNEIEGLICNPTKDALEEVDSQFSVWLSCKFDLNRVKARPIDAPEPKAAEKNNLNNLESTEISHKDDYHPKSIFLSTIPKCESLVIRGSSSRVIECTTNPIKVVLRDGDNEIIVRAKEYKPKTIKLGGVNENETIQVLLDLL